MIFQTPIGENSKTKIKIARKKIIIEILYLNSSNGRKIPVHKAMRIKNTILLILFT
jgi:hypothetical protein